MLLINKNESKGGGAARALPLDLTRPVHHTSHIAPQFQNSTNHRDLRGALHPSTLVLRSLGATRVSNLELNRFPPVPSPISFMVGDAGQHQSCLPGRSLTTSPRRMAGAWVLACLPSRCLNHTSQNGGCVWTATSFAFRQGRGRGGFLPSPFRKMMIHVTKRIVCEFGTKGGVLRQLTCLLQRWVVRTQPPTATGAPAQTSTILYHTISYHTIPCHAV